jgi:Ser-tRNA(Ala) deacylase AlaX
MYKKQHRINQELRLRISDLEWLQMSQYHKDFTKNGSGIKVVDLSNSEINKEVEDIEKDIDEIDKILEEAIETTEEEDVISQMILKMIQQHADNTILDENLENIVNTPYIDIESLKQYKDDEIIDMKAEDISQIENKLMADITETKSYISNDSEVSNNDWISETYTLSELKELCKKFNIINKGNKKDIIQRLLDNNVYIPKKDECNSMTI